MRKAFIVLGAVSLSASAFAQTTDIPLRNWTVPPYAAASASGGFTTMTDITGPRPFIPVEPCRIVDTRLGSFPAGFGPPNLTPGVERVFDLNSGPCPGIPHVDAYSLNVTIVAPSGPGHLVIWPTTFAEPTVSSINYTAGQTIANAVIVPAGKDGGVSVKAGVSGTHLLIDINGYFSSVTSSNSTFGVLIEDSVFPAALFRNTASGCFGACALHAASDTTVAGRAIVGAVRTGGADSAGVLGVHGDVGVGNPYTGAGVRGHGIHNGVLGISPELGVAGSLLSSFVEIAWGALGSSLGVDPPSNNPPWGVFAGGNIGATGTKHFLDPHPTDPKLSIAYISLEGPEAGTYFRGRGKFQNGIARIPVPEHFRLVTDPEGLTVQVTPIGPMASVSVVKYDLNEIVVQASRNVEFFYFVNGVRAAFKDLAPLRTGGDFMPRSAEAKLPQWLSPAQRRVLIRNGTYREDGTVNAETAQRLGWDRVWKERERPNPAATAD